MAWERDDHFQGIPFLAMSAFMLAVWKYGGGVVCTKSERGCGLYCMCWPEAYLITSFPVQCFGLHLAATYILILPPDFVGRGFMGYLWPEKHPPCCCGMCVCVCVCVYIILCHASRMY